MGSSNIHRHPLNDNLDQWHISYNIMAYKLLKIKSFTSVNFQINRLMLGVPEIIREGYNYRLDQFVYQ